MKGKLKVHVSITLYSETDGEKLIKEAEDVFDKMEPAIDTDDKYIFISWTERSSYYYSPAVYYLRNGDPGYPAEYEEYTVWDEEDVWQELQSWQKKYEFEIDRVDVTKDSGEDW